MCVYKQKTFKAKVQKFLFTFHPPLSLLYLVLSASFFTEYKKAHRFQLLGLQTIFEDPFHFNISGFWLSNKCHFT